MNTDDKVCYCYNKLIEYSVGYHTHFFLIKNNNLIKEQIYKIIQEGYEDYLNDSTLCYLSRTNCIIDKLNLICGSDMNRIHFLMEYYRECITERYSMLYSKPRFNKRRYTTKKLPCNRSTSYSLLNNNDQDKITFATNYYHDVNQNTDDKYFYMESMSTIIFTYCILYDKVDEFKELCNMFYDNYDHLNESLVLNDLDVKGYSLIDRYTRDTLYSLITRVFNVLDNYYSNQTLFVNIK